MNRLQIIVMSEIIAERTKSASKCEYPLVHNIKGNIQYTFNGMCAKGCFFTNIMIASNTLIDNCRL